MNQAHRTIYITESWSDLGGHVRIISPGNVIEDRPWRTFEDRAKVLAGTRHSAHTRALSSKWVVIDAAGK